MIPGYENICETFYSRKETYCKHIEQNDANNVKQET